MVTISKRSSRNGKNTAAPFRGVATATVMLFLMSTLSDNGCINAGFVKEDTSTGYGVDISFPIHHASVSANFPWLQSGNNSQPLQLLGDRQSFYDDFIRSCRQKDGRSCDDTENIRINMNLNQPASMVVRALFGTYH